MRRVRRRMNFTFSLRFLYHFRECCGRGRAHSERGRSALVPERSSRQVGERLEFPLALPAIEHCCGRGRPRSGKTLLFLYIFFTEIAFQRLPERAPTFQSWTCSCCSPAGMALSLVKAYLISFQPNQSRRRRLRSGRDGRSRPNRWLLVTMLQRDKHTLIVRSPFPPGKAQRQFGSSDTTGLRTPSASSMNPVHG